jgi:hypothetical protein
MNPRPIQVAAVQEQDDDIAQLAGDNDTALEPRGGEEQTTVNADVQEHPAAEEQAIDITGDHEPQEGSGIDVQDENIQGANDSNGAALDSVSEGIVHEHAEQKPEQEEGFGTYIPEYLQYQQPQPLFKLKPEKPERMPKKEIQAQRKAEKKIAQKEEIRRNFSKSVADAFERIGGHR